MAYAPKRDPQPMGLPGLPCWPCFDWDSKWAAFCPDEFERDAMCAGAQKTIAEKGNVETVQYFCDFQPITIIKETP